jgi:hypothetical protein
VRRGIVRLEAADCRLRAASGLEPDGPAACNL